MAPVFEVSAEVSVCVLEAVVVSDVDVPDDDDDSVVVDDGADEVVIECEVVSGVDAEELVSSCVGSS